MCDCDWRGELGNDGVYFEFEGVFLVGEGEEFFAFCGEQI